MAHLDGQVAEIVKAVEQAANMRARVAWDMPAKKLFAGGRVTTG